MFFVTEDWYLLSHRLQLARACRERGWEVVVATRVRDHGSAIEREGFRVVPLRLRRRERAPWNEIRSFCELVWIFARERPDLIHQVGLKPVIYGSLAAIIVRPGVVINALAGMGYIFTSGRPMIRLMRTVVQLSLKVCLRPTRHWLIVQNDEDARAMKNGRVVAADRLSIIKGAGVDIERFPFMPDPEISPGDPVILAMVSRMLMDKGVRELVLAARILKHRGTRVRVWLVGAPDPDNPTSITEETLRQWHNEGCIEWLGPLDDIPELWSKAHIALLPSYREGMPKSLLEAASCGRPIVTTDIPGCTDLVDDGVTGFTVPPHDWTNLADAIERLATSPEMRAKMGTRIRAKVVAKFADNVIIEQTLGLYQQALSRSNAFHAEEFEA